MIKYNEGEFVECMNVSNDNFEGLIVGDVYQVVGVDKIHENIIYALRDSEGNLHFSIDRFAPICTIQTSPCTIDFTRPAKVEPKVTHAQTEPKVDMVNHPAHYNQYRVEVIDIIEDATKGLDGFQGLLLGNVIKYVLRFRFKNGVEDLKKARFYLDKLINILEEK